MSLNSLKCWLGSAAYDCYPPIVAAINFRENQGAPAQFADRMTKAAAGLGAGDHTVSFDVAGFARDLTDIKFNKDGTDSRVKVTPEEFAKKKVEVSPPPGPHEINDAASIIDGVKLNLKVDGKIVGQLSLFPGTKVGEFTSPDGSSDPVNIGDSTLLKQTLVKAGLSPDQADKVAQSIEKANKGYDVSTPVDAPKAQPASKAAPAKPAP